MKPSRNLGSLRKKIDRIDVGILRLLSARGKAVQRIGRFKARAGGNYHAPAREERILARLKKANPGPYPSAAVQGIFREILSASLALESELGVAYLGPLASFTHLAAIKGFGRQQRFVPCAGIEQVFEEVEKERSDYGIVPVENSTEGVVTHTLDCFLETPLKIQGEILLTVSHNLLNLSGRIETIRHLYSHPHATAQCRAWLEKHLKGVPVIDVESTSAAALAAAKDPEGAAIAGEAAAELYHLRCAGKKIEDRATNRTRFLIIGRSMPKRSRHDKTSLLFSVKDEVGVLHRMLQPFAESGINLTKIESRPMGRWHEGGGWEYVFFLDLDGHVDDPKVGRAVRHLEKSCRFMKVLGSYPKAR